MGMEVPRISGAGLGPSRGFHSPAMLLLSLLHPSCRANLALRTLFGAEGPQAQGWGRGQEVDPAAGPWLWQVAAFCDCNCK